MYPIAGFVGVLLIIVVLWDGFSTIVLPRRVTSGLSLARLFYFATWRPWASVARRISDTARREYFLSLYGPFSLIWLLSIWAFDLIIAFALIQWSLGTQVHAPELNPDFWSDLYMSGVTFFTLGFGDVIPINPAPRVVGVAEAGMGFGFLAIIIGYLPVMYQAFSQREVNVSLLDERAGSPPTAGELLKRHAYEGGAADLVDFLKEWERWCAELLESHLSYPVLGFYRSQHDNQSWVSSLTMILDACTLISVGVDGIPRRQAELTFAMARHAAVDLSQIYNTPPMPPQPDRLPPDELAHLRAVLREAGVPLREGDDADSRLTELRRIYEPYVFALSRRMMADLPPWLPELGAQDMWETTAWERGQRASVR